MASNASAALDDIEIFKQWASRMDCPPDCLPSDDVLRRTFNNPQGRCLIQLTRRIAPAAQVLAVRNNILVHKLHQHRSVTERSIDVRHQHSADVQRMLLVRQMRAQRDRLRQHIDQKRQQLDALRSKVTANGRLCTRATADVRLARLNERFLSAKQLSLDEALQRERRLAETIAKLMPVQYLPSVHSDGQAAEALHATAVALRSQYAAADAAQPIPLNSSSAIWTRLTLNLRNVPNCLLWSQLAHAHSRNVAAMRQLRCDATRAQHLTGGPNSSPTGSVAQHLQLFLKRARAKHIGIALQVSATVHALEQTFSASIEPYEALMQHIHATFRAAAGAEYCADTVDEYIAEYTAMLYNRGQLDYLRAELQTRQREYDARCARLSGHIGQIAALQQLYADAERTVNETRDASTALYAIKQKLQYLEGQMRALLVEARGSAQPAPASLAHRRFLNATLTGLDTSLGSFNLSHNSDLCSTRVDEPASQLDGTVNRTVTGASPLQPARPLGYASHVAELTAYADCGLDAIVRHAGRTELRQRLADEALPQHGLLATDLYRMDALLAQAQRTAEYVTALDGLRLADKDRSLAVPVHRVDAAQLAQKCRQNADRAVEWRDKCDGLLAALQQKQLHVDRLYEFLAENALRRFVPAAKTFNGRTYRDYEDEFMVHYNIVVAARSGDFQQVTK